MVKVNNGTRVHVRGFNATFFIHAKTKDATHSKKQNKLQTHSLSGSKTY